MDEEQIIKTIINNYSFLGDESSNELMKSFNLISLDKETVLVKEGQYSDKAYYIISGGARAYYLKDGRDISDWFAFENSFVCSVNSFYQNIPSLHFIETLEPSILLEISRDSVERLSSKYHEIERLVRNIITETMLQLQERVVSIQFQSAEQRYKKILAIHSNITQRVPLKHIASYIGITLETLSRIRKPQKSNLI